MSATPDRLLEDARQFGPELAALRHDLHRHPELGLHLPRTRAAVLDALAGLPLEVSTSERTSAVTAVLRGGRPGPAVLLRADMDALPVTEQTGEPFASTVPGAMHACGHDLHVAALVGAARLLAARREELPGSVVLMFQPGEELGTGAQLMLAEGVLEAAGSRPVAAYAQHVVSALLPVGVVGGRPGVLLAAADTVLVELRGSGGHGSMPHLAVDPVPALCEMVTALHTMTTRRVDPFDPAVLTVGRISAGTAENVIADTASFGATVRTFSVAARQRLLAGIESVCRGVAAAHGVELELTVRADCSATVNDPGEAARVERTAADVLGESRYVALPNPITGSEDFCFVLEEVPGAYFAVGATPPGVDPNLAAYNHSPLARFDDGAIPIAAAMLAALAVDRLDAG